MQLAHRIGLRGRLILILLAVFAVLVGVSVGHVVEHRNEQIDYASKNLLHDARLIAARQLRVEAQADAILSSLMLLPELRPGAPAAACAQVLAARMKQETEFIQIGRVLPDGDIACAAVPAPQKINIADRNWFQQALKSDRVVIGDVLIGRIVAKPIVVFSKGMRDERGRVTAVLYLALDLAWLHRELATARLPAGARLMVVDAQGMVAVRHPDPEGWVGRSAAHLPKFKLIQASGSEGVSEAAGLDGMWKIYAFTPLLNTVSGPMTLWLSVPKAVLTAPAQRELAVSLTIALTLLLLTLWLVMWGGNRMLVRPLLALSRAATRFGSGDHAARSGLPHSDDDIGRLARAFDEMTAAVVAGEQRFRAVSEASLDALFILTCVRGEDGRILDFEFADLNPRAEEMLGMARAKVIGQKLCELLPVNRTGSFFDKYVTVATTGTPLEEEFPIDTPQIKAKWLRHQVVRVNDGIAIFSHDITPWKEVGAEIKRLGKRNTQILESAGEGIFGLDSEGRCTFINPAAAAMLQSPADELVGQLTHAIYHHTRADGTPYPREECPIYAAYRDGIAHRGADEVFWRRDGSRFPVEYVSTPIRDEDGELIGAVVSFSDISERKANEKALARAIRALKTLSAGNMALVRATDEMALLQTVCRIVVENGGYRMAWVGYADDNPEKTVTPKAWAGVTEDYIDKLNPTWADTERGQGPNSRAIRSGELQVSHDVQTDPGFAHWRALAAEQGFASVFAAPLAVDGKVIGALSIYAAETDAFDADEIRLLEELAGDLAFGIASLRTRAERDRNAWQHLHHAEILQRSLEQSIQAIADIVDARDPYTAGHQRRVGELAVAIAQEMGFPEEKIHGIHLAASIHDLGKIHVPAEILSKPGKLSDIEFMLIKTHPQAGYDILKDVEFPWPIADMVWQHHEKLDGSGYPQGLKDGKILLESRIMTVADVVEAMSSHRPYRAALGIEVALKEIERGRGSAYDTAVADACLKLFREGKFAFQT